MMNNEQKKETRKLPGFYIALCCCVLVIGIAGYFTERANNKQDNAMINTADVENIDTSEVFSDTEITSGEDVQDNSISPDSYIPESEIVTENNAVPDDTSEEIYPVNETVEDEAVQAVSGDGIIAEYAVDNPDITEAAVIVSAEDYPLSMPVNGAVLDDYSDELSYNSALADWRTHNGIDIGAETGGSVCAAADGVIEEITDNAFGDVIVISHSGGLETKYMGLNGTEPLSVGDEVKSGDVIGLIGESAGENVTDSHLHFEVYSDGKPVNPMEYIAH